MVQDLLVATESVLTGGEQQAGNATAQVDGESAVRVLTVIGDIASHDLLENEERSYETAGGTVLRVMAPSSERISSGFLIGPVSVPPLDGTTHQNVTIQVISWAVNLFGKGDVSDAVLTLNVRRGGSNVVLTNLASPLRFTLDVSERLTGSGNYTFERSCVFWNTTSETWSHRGLEIVRANLTQVRCGHSVP